jgi:hypothetical protein
MFEFKFICEFYAQEYERGKGGLFVNNIYGADNCVVFSESFCHLFN